jgi:UDP-3-O-[3-hydroxymyristoyl] glucosamine N-acyltransferase
MLPSKNYSLQEIAHAIGATVHGDTNYIISGINSLAEANAKQISFLDNPKYQPQLATTHAGAVILAAEHLSECPSNALVTPQPYVAYAKIAQLFWAKPKPTIGIHPTAIIHETAQIKKGVSIGPYAVIGQGVIIGENSVIGSHCSIDNDCEIGESTELAARVTLYYQVKIGNHCIIHSGVVIGSDGFGFAPNQSTYEKIPQLGRVIIEDHVEIGANTTIDRGALSDTFIAAGVKLDNQIQIGHNVKIGANTVIAGCTGIAGSTEIGKNCMIGGATGIAGHIKISDHVMLTGMAAVTNSIHDPGVYSSGTGLLPRAKWQKVVARLRHLNDLAKTVQKIKKVFEEN